MTNLSTLPINDDFETTLSASWNGAVGTVSVNDTPGGSMPASTYSYIVVNLSKPELPIKFKVHS